MKKNQSVKMGVWTALLAATVGLTACQKDVADDAEQNQEPEAATMSAEPAENTEPAIVASDLDDIDNVDAADLATELKEAPAADVAESVEPEAATEESAAEEGTTAQ